MTTLTHDQIAEKGSELEHASAEECLAFAAEHETERGTPLATLGVWAALIGRAKRSRLAGDIQRASGYEREAERLYRALPEACRW